MNQIKLKTTGQMQIPVCRSEVVTESSTVDSSRNANMQNVDPKQGSGNAESLKVPGNLGSTEFTLPLFDENKGMNPVAVGRIFPVSGNIAKTVANSSKEINCRLGVEAVA
jgi:hypothetical protein